ncbi:MAG: universal stress protein [Stappiaceae bacterium]
MNMFKRVLATIDLGDPESSVSVVNGALELIEKGDTLHVLCVVPEYGVGVVGSFFPKDHEKKAVEEATKQLHAFSAKYIPDDVEVQHVVAHGNIYEEILEAAENVSADIIVVGSHRPKLRDYLLGPNAARVVRHAPQSVMVVRTASE